MLFNVVGGSSLTLYEVNEAAELISQAVDPEANIVFGVSHDPSMDDEVRITLIATGFVDKLGLTGISREDELAQYLRGLKSEEELDVPSFLRRPLYIRRWRQSITQKTKPNKPPFHNISSN